MDADIAFRLLRTAIYLWVGIEAFFLGFLYRIGYRNYKQSNIIRSLQKMFFALGAFFILLAFAPLTTFLDEGNTVASIIMLLLTLLSLPVGWFMEKFKQFTLERVKKDEPTIPERPKMEKP